MAGNPARLPYFVAKALSVRAGADARLVETRTVSRASVREIESLTADIEAEVRAIVDGKSLYEVAVPLAPVIGQYVCLRRGLLSGANLTGPLPPPTDSVWDDGLADLRLVSRAFAPNGESVVVPLGTISDLQWYLDWSQGDPQTTDLRRVQQIGLREILDRLGVPETLSPASGSVVPALLMIALPTYRRRAEGKLNDEFRWASPAQIAECAARKPAAEQPVPAEAQASHQAVPPYRFVRFGNGFELRFEGGATQSPYHAVLVSRGKKLGMYEPPREVPDGRVGIVLRKSANFPEAWNLSVATSIRIAPTDGRRAVVHCEFEDKSTEKYDGSVER